MAIATEWRVAHKCGHDQIRDLSKVPISARAGRARQMERWDCTDCWGDKRTDKWRTEHQEEQAAAIAAWELRVGMPALEGTEAQVVWAAQVRFELLRSAFELSDTDEEYFELHVEAAAQEIRSAAWWIDQRETKAEDVEELLTDAVSQVAAKKKSDAM